MESDLACGGVAVALRGTGTPDLVISLRATLDRGFFVRAAPRLEQFMKTTRARITLDVDGLRVPGSANGSTDLPFRTRDG